MTTRILSIVVIATVVAMTMGHLEAAPGHPEQAEPSTGWRLAERGHFGGPATALAASGHVAFLGVGPRLVTLDISHPDAPVQLAEIGPAPGVINDIVMVGQRLYLTYGSWYHTMGTRLSTEPSGLWIVDVGQAAAPRVVGMFTEVAPAGAEALDVAEPYVYIAARDAGLQVLDVSDATRPVLVATSALVEGAYRVAVQSSVAYVTLGGGDIWLVDVTVPAQPRVVAALPNVGLSTDLVLSEKRMYIASGFSVVAMDISVPLEPRWLGFEDGQGFALTLAAAGERVFVSREDFTDPADVLEIVDFPDGVVEFPNQGSPVLKAATNLTAASAMVASPDRLLMATPDKGLVIVDTTDPTVPVEVADEHRPAGPARLALRGHQAFLADAGTGLHVLDVSEPDRPRTLGLYAAPGVVDVAVDETLAYVAAGEGGIRVVDVSNPAQPREVASLVADRAARRLAVTGELLVVAEDAVPPEVRLLDLSSPGRLRDLGPLPTPGMTTTYSVAAQDGLAFLGHDGGLAILDIRQPAQAHLVGTYTLPQAAAVRDIVVDGSTAYLAAESQGLRVVDVADPRHPVETATYMPGFSVDALAETHGNLVIAGRLSGGDGDSVAAELLRVTGPNRVQPLAPFLEPARQELAWDLYPTVAMSEALVLLAAPRQGLTLLVPSQDAVLYLPWLQSR